MSYSKRDGKGSANYSPQPNIRTEDFKTDASIKMVDVGKPRISAVNLDLKKFKNRPFQN